MECPKSRFQSSYHVPSRLNNGRFSFHERATSNLVDFRRQVILVPIFRERCVSWREKSRFVDAHHCSYQQATEIPAGIGGGSGSVGSTRRLAGKLHRTCRPSPPAQWHRTKTHERSVSG